MQLKDKVAIITGGTGGLGRSVVEEFLAEGARVVSTYIDEEELKEVMPLLKENKARLMFVRTDVTREKQVERLVKKALSSFKGLHILANLIGGFTYAEIIDTSPDTLDRMLELNLKTAFLMSKAVLPHMMRQRYGKIINVSSRPALKGTKGVGAYAASKAALLNLTETLASEVLEYDINVNAILPSTIDTPANRRDMPNADFSLWVKPKEIARVLVFLASDDSKPISGAAIPVYGKG
ncbi:MAG: SDR family NAD(P)-dependent oxidoreductase [Candidatus Caldarchaeum sp.]